MPVRSQPDPVLSVFVEHSLMPSVRFGLNPDTVTVILSPSFNPVVGVAVALDGLGAAVVLVVDGASVRGGVVAGGDDFFELLPHPASSRTTAVPMTAAFNTCNRMNPPC